MITEIIKDCSDSLFDTFSMAVKKYSEEYRRYQEEKERIWESLCNRCGGCCGAYDDPCVHLRKEGGRYYCSIYPNRFGMRKTVKGEDFKCVPIREIINTHWANDHICAYKKFMRKTW